MSSDDIKNWEILKKKGKSKAKNQFRNRSYMYQQKIYNRLK